ncbi:hypothetical protein N5A93_19425 [Roseovarius sp. EGI FJ00037]|uniref:hypothetical protein n=1 Tax=Roseovarius salincola TaxID=2978479 RepID=UPI0022A8CA88|nr:hypothetical protein [Roseovarius sp. EGI FJ00037]MCZ0814389.1 hypothetical protein [Roseovarius sp. EGI FJ00037]
MAKTDITLSASQAQAIHGVLTKARMTVSKINPNLGNQLMECAKFLENPVRFGTEVPDEDVEEPSEDYEDGFTEPPYGDSDEPVAATTNAGGGENVPIPDGPEESAEPEAS